mmetsp:Transcript_14697/g.26674  ORF Transcript_14697/g.26674 Transcript_14697/m.26674 type:complete len:90 (+) Transcript_14697:1397-1666(+)
MRFASFHGVLNISFYLKYAMEIALLTLGGSRQIKRDFQNTGTAYSMYGDRMYSLEYRIIYKKAANCDHDIFITYFTMEFGPYKNSNVSS